MKDKNWWFNLLSVQDQSFRGRASLPALLDFIMTRQCAPTNFLYSGSTKTLPIQNIFPTVTTCARDCFLLKMSLLILLLLTYAPRETEGGVEGCPKKCFCNPMNKYVYCSKKGLHIIPDTLPESTQHLNLNGNSFQSKTLQRINMSPFGSLEHLYISECGLEEIEVGAFTDMKNLQWLDLSENKLTHIHDKTFQGLTLKHLFLNNNHMLQLTPRSFIGLVTNGLHLHNCSLTTISSDILEPLKGTLKNLWLNGNLIGTFDEELKPIFSTISHLRLGGNPIRCRCKLAWLKDFFDSEQNVFKGAEPPSCRYPAKLKNQSFDDLTKAHFSCQAPAFNNIDALFEADHAKLKCSAYGEPTPTLFWILPSGRTFKYLPPDSRPQSPFLLSAALSSSSSSYAQQPNLQFSFDELDRNEAILHLKIPNHSFPHHSEPSSSSSFNTNEAHLQTGEYVCVANNQMGNVTLIINVTWPNRTERHHHQTHQFRNNHRHHGEGVGTEYNLPKPIVVEGPSRPKETDDDSTFKGKSLIQANLISTPTPVVPSNNDDTLNIREANDGTIQMQSVAKEGIFSLAELVVAVVATHLLTVALVLCLLFIRNAVVKSRRQKARYVDGPLHAPPLTPTGPLISSTPRLPAHLIKDRLQNSDPTYDKVGQSFSDIYNSSAARYPHHQFINR